MRLRLLVMMGAVLSVGFLCSVSARADQFTFSTRLGIGNTGVLAGNFNLVSVTNHGSGTGAATAFTLTNVPSGFGTLDGGNVATAWADQVSNSFTVVNGTVTSDLFFAVTSASDPSDVLCLNSTAAEPNYGKFTCVSQLNELHVASGDFGYNFGGLGGVTFTDTTNSTSVTPEPSSITLLGTGILCLAGAVRKRFA